MPNTRDSYAKAIGRRRQETAAAQAELVRRQRTGAPKSELGDAKGKIANAKQRAANTQAAAQDALRALGQPPLTEAQIETQTEAVQEQK